MRFKASIRRLKTSRKRELFLSTPPENRQRSPKPSVSQDFGLRDGG